jgi:hypothetical protein
MFGEIGPKMQGADSAAPKWFNGLVTFNAASYGWAESAIFYANPVTPYTAVELVSSATSGVGLLFNDLGAAATQWNFGSSIHSGLGLFELRNLTNSQTVFYASPAGDVTINSPSSGNPLTVTGNTSSANILVNGTNAEGLRIATTATDGAFLQVFNGATFLGFFGAAAQQIAGGAIGDLAIACNAGQNLTLGVFTTPVLTVASTGGVQIAAPSSAISLTVSGPTGNWVADLVASGVSGSSYGLIVTAGTTSTDVALLVREQTGSPVYLEIFGDGHGTLGPSSTLGLSWTTTGAMTIAAPSSGSVTLMVTSPAGGAAVEIAAGPFYQGSTVIPSLVMNSSGADYGQIFNSATQVWALGYGTSIDSNGTGALTWNATGNVVINAPSSGNALVVNGAANSYAAVVQTTSLAAGTSYGLQINAGTNSADTSFIVRNQAESALFMQITGAGNGFLGPNATNNLSWSATGNFTLALASSGGASLNLPASTAAVPVIAWATGTLLTTASAGVEEFDGKCWYVSPATSTRGVVCAEYAQYQNGSTHTLTSQTAAQAIFNQSASGAVTLPTGVYFFEMLVSLTSMSATSGSFGFALGGSATFSFAAYITAFKVAAAATPSTTPTMAYTFAALTTIVTANTATAGYMKVEGLITVTATGTVIPQVSLTVAAAAVVGAQSYFKCHPVGASGFTKVGNWS